MVGPLGEGSGPTKVDLRLKWLMRFFFEYNWLEVSYKRVAESATKLRGSK